MLDLKLHLAVHFKEQLKMHKKVTKRMHLTLYLMVQLKRHLLVQWRMCSEVSSEGTPKGVLRDLYKDA